MTGKYYHTKESVEEYAKLAKDVSGKELIDQFNTYLEPNSTILEIGSGPGTDWAILNKKHSVVGSDNSQEFIHFLNRKHPNGEFILLDAVHLESSNTFDGIYSNKVLHHLTDQELTASINRQHDLLNSKGIICHSFWKGEGDEVFKGLFVNYHTQRKIEAFFGNSFDILSIADYAEFEEGDSILLIARKK